MGRRTKRSKKGSATMAARVAAGLAPWTRMAGFIANRLKVLEAELQASQTQLGSDSAASQQREQRMQAQIEELEQHNVRYHLAAAEEMAGLQADLAAGHTATTLRQISNSIFEIRSLGLAEPDGTNSKARGLYSDRYKGRDILHKCAHRQHVEVEAVVFSNLRNMGSAKLDLRGGLLAALVENAGSADAGASADAEEDNGLYTALFGMLCCLTDSKRPDLRVAAGQALINCSKAFRLEHNIKKREVTVTVQHAKAAGKGTAPRRKPTQEGVEEHVPPMRQARVGTGPTTHRVLGGPQMSAINPQTLDVNEDPSYGIMSPLEGNLWQLGGIPSPCPVTSPLSTSLCSPRPSPAQQPSAKRIGGGGGSYRPAADGGAHPNATAPGGADLCAAAGGEGSRRLAAGEGATPSATGAGGADLCAAAGGEGSRRLAAGEGATPGATAAGGADLRAAAGGEGSRRLAAGEGATPSATGAGGADLCAAAGGEGSRRLAAGEGATPGATAAGGADLRAAAGGEGSRRLAAGEEATPSATGVGGADLCAAAGGEGSRRLAAGEGATPSATGVGGADLCAAAGGEGSRRLAAGEGATPSATGVGGADLRAAAGGEGSRRLAAGEGATPSATGHRFNICAAAGWGGSRSAATQQGLSPNGRPQRTLRPTSKVLEAKAAQAVAAAATDTEFWESQRPQVVGPRPVHSGSTTGSDWDYMDREEMESRVEAMLSNKQIWMYLTAYDALNRRLTKTEKGMPWYKALHRAVDDLKLAKL
ncbi:hypothetical protein QJQ45_016583 [Haematococcus lacustris]|nr:hypothetical protein QJQ45_016583 [Haematococcus lacustris]